MLLFRCLIPFFVLLLAMSASGCNPFPETWQWNQKLTVEVVTPEGVRVGSAITSVRWQEKNSSGNYPGSYRGEATVVDLGQGRFLFALLSEETRYLALRTFADVLGEKAQISEVGFEAMADTKGMREVPRENYPLLVTFHDINDPTTVTHVDPDDLAASFGPGVSLKRIALTITDEPGTGGEVEKLLSWLGWSREQFLNAGGGETPLKMPNISRGGYRTLGRTDFAKGE